MNGSPRNRREPRLPRSQARPDFICTRFHLEKLIDYSDAQQVLEYDFPHLTRHEVISLRQRRIDDHADKDRSGCSRDSVDHANSKPTGCAAAQPHGATAARCPNDRTASTAASTTTPGAPTPCRAAIKRERAAA